MLVRIFLLISLVFVTSCSSIRKYKVIPVDSSPRGISVYDENKTLVGNTPFFYEIDPSWTNDFYVKTHDGKFDEVNYNCKIDWTQSVIPAAVVSMIAPPLGFVLGGGFMGMDIARGGVYKCDRSLYFKKDTKLESRPEKLSIKRILILSPNVPDESFSDEIVKIWKENNFKKYNVKDELVDYYETKDILHFNGVDHLKKTTPMELRPKVLRKIGSEFEVSHVLFFDIKDKGDKYIIRPLLADAFSHEEIEEKYLHEYEVKKPKSIKTTALSTILQSISFLPNSASVVYQSRPKMDFVDTASLEKFSEHKSGNHPNALPRFLSILSADTIDHPQFYSDWDVSMNVSPSFGATSWQSSFNNYKINLLSYNAAYNLNINLHTSFGAVGFGIGYGLAYVVGEDSLNEDISKVTSIIKSNLNYVAFFNDRYYFKFGATSYAPASKFDNTRYDLESWTEFSVGIGYYFPEIRSVIRNWLPF